MRGPTNCIPERFHGDQEATARTTSKVTSNGMDELAAPIRG